MTVYCARKGGGPGLATSGTDISLIGGVSSRDNGHYFLTLYILLSLLLACYF